MWFPCVICLCVGVIIGLFAAGLGQMAKEENTLGQGEPERTPPAKSDEVD